MENKRTVLHQRPGVNNKPHADNFKTEPCPYPSEELEEGKVLVKTGYLSVDPYMRGRMNDDTGTDYMLPWQIGEAATGGGVGVVVRSNHGNFTEGDIVDTFFMPWQLFSSIDGKVLNQVDKTALNGHYSMALGLSGLPGLTAILGIREKAHIKPGKEQTCVISGAAGACGSLAGQIARLEGCSKVVGICGTEAKCSYLKSELGFDVAINYKTENVGEKLGETCPSGIDVYFDNVGGDISNAVIRLMNKDSNVVLCGQISTYNSDTPYPNPLPTDLQQACQKNNITRERFMVLTYADKFASSVAQLLEWHQQEKLKLKETVLTGLENVGKAFVDMMNGGNIGKQIVHVSDI